MNSKILSPLIIVLIFVGCYLPKAENKQTSIEQIQRAADRNYPREIRDDESKEEYLQFIVSSQKYVFWKKNYNFQSLWN